MIEEVLGHVEADHAYFWATHQGAELDLLLIRHGRAYGVECKFVDAPVVTASMRIALADLELEHLTVIYPGTQRFMMADRVEVVPLSVVCEGQSLFPLPRTAAKPRQIKK